MPRSMIALPTDYSGATVGDPTVWNEVPMGATVADTGRAAPQTHYEAVVDGLRQGRLTPVLGAGASLYGRPDLPEEEWIGRYPPSSTELTAYLAKRYKCPPEESSELLHVSQYIYALRGGSGPLYETLHDLFVADYPKSPLHDFLASVPGALRAKGKLRHPPVIVTTNYDDLVERALAARGEAFDLVVYMAEGPHEGGFSHREPGGELKPVDRPEERTDIDPDKRTVVLKIHGFVDLENQGRDDSYVITEDHYIEYLTRTDLDTLIPVKVLERLRNCHLLFLGYSLRDWNLRAILSRLYADRLKDWDWWAIQRRPTELEQRSWQRRSIEIFDQPLDEYVKVLKEHFDRELEE
jgi:SIR2-like protein